MWFQNLFIQPLKIKLKLQRLLIDNKHIMQEIEFESSLLNAIDEDKDD